VFVDEKILRLDGICEMGMATDEHPQISSMFRECTKILRQPNPPKKNVIYILVGG
jgi:hypothetical protein